MNIGWKVINLDIVPPENPEPLAYWSMCDIRSFGALLKIVEAFPPTYLAHLAAVTFQDKHSINDYDVNIEGTGNIIEIVNRYLKIKKTVFASTQYVVSLVDLMYKPIKLYSKISRNRLAFRT